MGSRAVTSRFSSLNARVVLTVTGPARSLTSNKVENQSTKMVESTPRINATYLENFQDRAVRIVGKVTQLRGTQATIDSNGPVTVNLRKASFFSIKFE